MTLLLRICRFYARQVHIIAVGLGLTFALFLSFKSEAGVIAFDLLVLFYGGIAGYALAGCLLVPAFVLLKYAGEDDTPEETPSAMETLLFRRGKKGSRRTPDPEDPDQ